MGRLSSSVSRRMAQNATYLAACVLASRQISRKIGVDAEAAGKAARPIGRKPPMSFKDLYALGTEGSTWSVKQDFDTVFNWDYDDGRVGMMGLYAKGKEMQWDAATRIDWSQELDEDNPEQMPEESLPIHMAGCYLKMSDKEKAVVRRNFQAWQLSQFMQGEQGALICAAKIVTQVPDVDSKFYASTQVIDEARHVESYNRLLEKFGVAYPMTPPLQELIDQVLRDSRWDMTYLGM